MFGRGLALAIAAATTVGHASAAQAAGPIIDLGNDVISWGRSSPPDPHKRRRFKMNARRQLGRKVCPAYRKGRK